MRIVSAKRHPGPDPGSTFFPHRQIEEKKVDAGSSPA
jgi:hypothetical protein